MARKTRDPKLIALLDDRAAAMDRYDRLFARLRRTMNALEKERRRLVRLAKRIEERENPKAAAAAAAGPAS